MPLAHLELDGRQVCVADSAAPAADAPTLVLIHGAGHDHQAWDPVAAALAADGLRTVVPDLPGHGGSDGPALAAVAAQAAWLLRLIDALKLSRFCLAGHSMGSLIALAAAAQAAERCIGLVLVGSVVPMPVAPALLDAARDDPATAHGMINKWSFGPVELLGETRLGELQARNLQRMERQAAGSLAIDLGACNAWHDGLATAARVRCPALLLCGERDRMTPPEAAAPLLNALRTATGDARMVQIPGAGHALMDEAPGSVADAMRTFAATST